jgi:predicted chitinase
MYELFGASVHEDIASNPDLVRTKYKLTSAFWFYDYNGLWVVANQTNCTPLRKRVNGGVNGLVEVKAYFKKYIALL